MSPLKPLKFHWGFTLAELLISLLILGEIATFTIPKILVSQQNQRFKAVTKEAVSMVAGAYQVYKATNTVTEDFGIKDLTPYLNYVSTPTGNDIDHVYGSGGTINCNGGWPACLKLHNGAIIDYGTPSTFGGTNSTSAVYFHVDPDGVPDYSAGGLGKSVEFWLFFNGRVASRGDTGPAPCQKWAGGGPWCYPADPAQIPPWFSWN